MLYTTAIFQRNDLYRSLLLKLVEHSSEPVLSVVGGGPLENFVSENDHDLEWHWTDKPLEAHSGCSLETNPDQGE